MNAIKKLFLLLLLSLSPSIIFSQDNTFVRKVEGAGRFPGNNSNCGWWLCHGKLC